MKALIFLTIILLLGSCVNKPSESSANSLTGTWKLISGTTIEKGDTTVTLYDKNVSFIKILNKTHFAFLQHDLKKGTDSTSVFVAGGGRYSLVSNKYTEHLEYCSARNWEGNDFSFTVSVRGDTLILTGVERVEKLGVDRLNIEKYVRMSL